MNDAANLSKPAQRFMKRWGSYLAEGGFLTYSRKAKKSLAVVGELVRAGLVAVHPHPNREIKVTAAE